METLQEGKQVVKGNKPPTWTMRERSPGTFTIALDLGGNKADGSRNRTYMTIKADGKAAAESELRRILEVDAAPAPGTIASMLTDWLRTERYQWREGTFVKYEGLARQHIIPFVGAQLIAEFTKPDGKAFYATLRENGRSENTVKQAHKVLSIAFTAAVDDETKGVDRNPVDRVKMVKTQVKEVVPPSESQVMEMLELARESGQWWYPALRLATFTGMRRGEIMGLRWENVNLAREFLDVRESLTYTSGRLRIEKPKTDAGSRRVDLDAETVAVLLAHKRAQEAHIEAMGAERVDQGIVFSKPDGGYFFPGTFSQTVNTLSKRTGRRMKGHALRHFHASVWLSRGAPLLPLSKRLGHASSKMTLDVYGHLMPDAQRAGLDIFVAAMNGYGNQPTLSGAPSYAPDKVGVKSGVNGVSPCLR